MTAGVRSSFVGNLTRDPELRYTQTGRAFALFGVAVNRRWRDRDDQWQETVEFVNCKMWGEPAEQFCTSDGIVRGTRVIVFNGRFDTETWTDRDGNDRKDMVCTVEEAGPSLRWATATVARIVRRDQAGGTPAAAQSVPPPPAVPTPPSPADGRYAVDSQPLDVPF